MERLALVALGGGAGAVARYLAGTAWLRLAGPERPYLATLWINVLGGLLMGVLVSSLALRGGAHGERWRLLLGVGVLGGFTTFSTFSLETGLLLQRREWVAAAAYAGSSVVGATAALFIGLWLGRRLFG